MLRWHVFHVVSEAVKDAIVDAGLPCTMHDFVHNFTFFIKFDSHSSVLDLSLRSVLEEWDSLQDPFDLLVGCKLRFEDYLIAIVLGVWDLRAQSPD